MRTLLPDFAESSAAPVFEVRPPSLVAAVPTAMVLVDYALSGGLATPTSDVSVFVQQIPRDLAAASHPIRAALAHGTALRDVMLAHIPAGHPGHQDWVALREWLAAVEDDEMTGLIEYGIQSNIAYDDPQATMPAAGGPLTRQIPAAKMKRLTAMVLADWDVPDAQGAAADLVERPAAARDVLVELLDVIWDGWLAEAWDRLPDHRPPVAGPIGGPASSAITGSQWLGWVTGLRPDPRYAEAADRASTLTVMACPGLGQALTLFDVDDVTFVLYSPGSASTDRPVEAVALTAVGSLGPVLGALGDTTRLSIVLQLIDSGPSTMTDLIEATGVHQTTVSRQVMALRKARLVTIDDRRRVVLQTGAIEEACHTLLAAIHRPTTAEAATRSDEVN